MLLFEEDTRRALSCYTIGRQQLYQRRIKLLRLPLRYLRFCSVCILSLRSSVGGPETNVETSRQFHFLRCDWSEFCCLETATRTLVERDTTTQCELTCTRQDSEHYVRCTDVVEFVAEFVHLMTPSLVEARRQKQFERGSPLQIAAA
jgi:hypothetical protein